MKAILHKSLDLLLINMTVGQLLSYLLTALTFFFLGKWYFQKQQKSNKITKKRIDIIKNLSPEESKIVSNYIKRNTVYQKLDMSSLIVHELCRKDIIVLSKRENLGRYTIKNWVLDLLKAKPDLLCAEEETKKSSESQS
jgi:hypothetical protein